MARRCFRSSQTAMGDCFFGSRAPHFAVGNICSSSEAETVKFILHPKLRSIRHGSTVRHAGDVEGLAKAHSLIDGRRTWPRRLSPRPFAHCVRRVVASKNCVNNETMRSVGANSGQQTRLGQ